MKKDSDGLKGDFVPQDLYPARRSPYNCHAIPGIKVISSQLLDTRIEWATAAIARFLPRLGASGPSQERSSAASLGVWAASAGAQVPVLDRRART